MTDISTIGPKELNFKTKTGSVLVLVKWCASFVKWHVPHPCMCACMYHRDDLPKCSLNATSAQYYIWNSVFPPLTNRLLLQIPHLFRFQHPTTTSHLFVP